MEFDKIGRPVCTGLEPVIAGASRVPGDNLTDFCYDLTIKRTVEKDLYTIMDNLIGRIDDKQPNPQSKQRVDTAPTRQPDEQKRKQYSCIAPKVCLIVQGICLDHDIVCLICYA